MRLLKRDLQFAVLQIARGIEVWPLQTLARQHGLRAKKEEDDPIEELFAAFLRQVDEGKL